jgi:hypothetical protein
MDRHLVSLELDLVNSELDLTSTHEDSGEYLGVCLWEYSGRLKI